MHSRIRKSQGILCSLGILVMLSTCSVGISNQQHETLVLPVEEQSIPEAEAAPSDDEPTQQTGTSRGQSTLRNDLTRGCQKGEPNPSGPRVGDPAIEFTLRDVKGESYTLSELLQEKPVVMIFGSFT